MRRDRGDIRVRSDVVTPALLTGGTNTGTLTSGGGLAGAFDGNTSQSYTASAYIISPVVGYGNTIGKDWGRFVVVTGVRLYSPTDYSFLSNGTTPVQTTVKVQGSNDGSAWTDISLEMTPKVVLQSIIDLVPTSFEAYKHHRVNIAGQTGATSCLVAECQFYGLEVS